MDEIDGYIYTYNRYIDHISIINKNTSGKNDGYAYILKIILVVFQPYIKLYTYINNLQKSGTEINDEYIYT